jgi:hypothetical protein
LHAIGQTVGQSDCEQRPDHRWLWQEQAKRSECSDGSGKPPRSGRQHGGQDRVEIISEINSKICFLTEEPTMRKLLLAAATLLASATAYAADPSVQFAANDSPQALPAETAVEPAKAPEPAKAAEPAPVVETTPVQASKPKQHAKRRESDEHKARRIAAKYGVSW